MFWDEFLARYLSLVIVSALGFGIASCAPNKKQSFTPLPPLEPRGVQIPVAHQQAAAKARGKNKKDCVQRCIPIWAQAYSGMSIERFCDVNALVPKTPEGKTQCRQEMTKAMDLQCQVQCERSGNSFGL